MRRGGDAAAAVVMMGVSGAGKSTLALKKAYRRQIIDDHRDVRLVFLEGSRELITERLAEPPGPRRKSDHCRHQSASGRRYRKDRPHSWLGGAAGALGPIQFGRQRMTVPTGLPTSSIDEICVNTIRTLCIDAVQQAKSGHPGTPMGMAPVVYTLWQEFLRFDPEDPIWPNRDRFVLSNGHASTLLYSMLHLTGVKAVNEQYETARHTRRCARRSEAVPPARQQVSGSSGIPLDFGHRDDDRPAGPGYRDQRRDGDRGRLAGASFQPARNSSCSTTTSSRCAATAA